MDFQTLNRRELQALCKLNKIPANITNIAMIDALNSLETVEGIEEFLNPSRCEGIEVTSPRVPPTSCRTTTRPKVKKPESESLHATVSRATSRGVRRQLSGEVNEVLKTPLVKKEANLQTTYTTRRSTRLTAKKLEVNDVIERERSEPVKIDSFLDEVKDLGKSIEEEYDNVLDESDENSKIEKVDLEDLKSDLEEKIDLDEDSKIEKIHVETIESGEKQLEKMDLEEKIDVNEALNDSVKEEDAVLVLEENTDSILIEADDGIDKNALSNNTETSIAVSEMKNEVSEYSNGTPYIADNIIMAVDEIIVESSLVDEVTVESTVVDVTFVKEDEEYLSDVSDNKENEENMNEKEGGDGDEKKAEKSLYDHSLRQLKKQLKALKIKNNMDANCVTEN